MVYAYDRAIPLPVKDLYDTQVMAMSINAAKDMYEKGQKQIDDFYNKYGDFISPIQKDMDCTAFGCKLGQTPSDDFGYGYSKNF